MSANELRDFLSGDIHHEMATAAGLLKLGVDAEVQRELGERLSGACERLRAEIASLGVQMGLLMRASTGNAVAFCSREEAVQELTDPTNPADNEDLVWVPSGDGPALTSKDVS